MKTKNTMKSGLLLGAAFALAFAFVPTASAELINFDLNSHPDGTEADDDDTNTWYGLRLDAPSNSATNTFRFNEASGDPMTLGASTVSATIDTDTGIMTITGTVFHIQDSDSRYSIAATIQLAGSPFSATTVDNLENNLVVGALDGTTVSLVLTPLDGGTFSPLSWIGHPMMAGMPDFHIENNHRGVSGLSGYGWLEPEDQRLRHQASQDWLFTMEHRETPPPDDVPEPASLALLGMGLAGVALRKKWFNA